MNLRMLIYLTVVTGIVYPLIVTGISLGLMKEKALGSWIKSRDKLVGSEFIGQKFETDRYFWSRPSAIGYNPLPSGGTNLGPINQDLKKGVDERASLLKNKHPNGDVPQDLLFSSASGLDPHISPEAALFQVNRVAQARGLEATALSKLVASLTESRQFGFLGEPRVNVLRLNIALDELIK